MAFKPRAQEGTLGRVVSQGAIGQSTEPWMAARLTTGTCLEAAISKPGELLSFELCSPNCSSALPDDDPRQQAAETVLGVRVLSSKVNALITSLQGHIHLFYIIFPGSGICFWGGGSVFHIAKSLLSV